jgi:hypothetical protein
MASELKREQFLDPNGVPLFLIEKGHSDRDGNPLSVWEVRHGGRTIRNEILDYDTALSLVEGMGGILTTPGDARSLAAEINVGGSVLQAALAPRITEMAEEIANGKNPLLTPIDRGTSKAAVVGGDLAKAMGGVNDSQATGVMEITTGLGGLKSHGIGERFEGAAEEPVAEAAIEALNEQSEANAAARDEDPDDTTRARERSRSNEGQGPARGGKATRSRSKPKASSKKPEGDTPQTAAGDNKPASASSPHPSGVVGGLSTGGNY